MDKNQGHKVKYLVLYTTNDTKDSVYDECIIIDTDRYPNLHKEGTDSLLPNWEIV